MEASGLYTFSDSGFAVGTPQTPPTSHEFEQFWTGINRNVDMTISEVSSDPAKSRPFETECDVLGVRVNVGNLFHGCLKLTNKASRYKRFAGFILRLAL